MRRIPHIVLWVVIGLVSLTPTRGSADEPGEIRILMLMGDEVGGYHYFTSDLWEQQGWNLTSTGLSPTLQPCNLGLPFHVDVLIRNIDDLTSYDCLAIMQSKAYTGHSHDDLLESPAALSLVQQAVAEGMLVLATCGGVRVLAAADVIEGRTVTGYADYAQEYIDAGAIYAGDGVPPIVDGNIMTSAHGRYYCQQITETMRAYFAAHPRR